MAWRARVIEFVGGDHANRIPLDVRRSVLLRARPGRVRDVDLIWEQVVLTLMIRSRLVDGGPRPWAGLSWATPRTSSRLGRLRMGCRACCLCRFRRRRQARTDSILTSVRSIKPQKSNLPVLGGPMSGSVTRRGWYSPTLKAMSSAFLVDGFGHKRAGDRAPRCVSPAFHRGRAVHP